MIHNNLDQNPHILLVNDLVLMMAQLEQSLAEMLVLKMENMKVTTMEQQKVMM